VVSVGAEGAVVRDGVPVALAAPVAGVPDEAALEAVAATAAAVNALEPVALVAVVAIERCSCLLCRPSPLLLLRRISFSWPMVFGD